VGTARGPAREGRYAHLAGKKGDFLRLRKEAARKVKDVTHIGDLNHRQPTKHGLGLSLSVWQRTAHSRGAEPDASQGKSAVQHINSVWY